MRTWQTHKQYSGNLLRLASSWLICAGPLRNGYANRHLCLSKSNKLDYLGNIDTLIWWQTNGLSTVSFNFRVSILIVDISKYYFSALKYCILKVFVLLPIAFYSSNICRQGNKTKRCQSHPPYLHNQLNRLLIWKMGPQVTNIYVV